MTHGGAVDRQALKIGEAFDGVKEMFRGFFFGLEREVS